MALSCAEGTNGGSARVGVYNFSTSVTQGCSWDLEFCAVDLVRAYSYLKHVQGGVSCRDETLDRGKIPVPTGQAF